MIPPSWDRTFDHPDVSEKRGSEAHSTGAPLGSPVAGFTVAAYHEAPWRKSTVAGSIQSGSYSHSELASSQGDRSVFKLYYDVKLASPRFSQGQATLIVMAKGSDLALLGFQLNSGLQ